MLENKVYIYNFADLKLIDQIDTYVNPSGLCAVNATKDDMVMACLGEGLGEVRVDLYSRNQVHCIYFITDLLIFVRHGSLRRTLTPSRSSA